MQNITCKCNNLYGNYFKMYLNVHPMHVLYICLFIKAEMSEMLFAMISWKSDGQILTYC